MSYEFKSTSCEIKSTSYVKLLPITYELYTKCSVIKSFKFQVAFQIKNMIF